MMKKILLLDDNKDTIDLMVEVLTYERYDVVSVQKGAGLLPMVEKVKPDLIMLDYRLAEGNGGELCQTIKSHPQFGRIPVVIFTAYMAPGLDLKQYGCDAIITKPFDLQDLIDTLQLLLQTSVYAKYP